MGKEVPELIRFHITGRSRPREQVQVLFQVLKHALVLQVPSLRVPSPQAPLLLVPSLRGLLLQLLLLLPWLAAPSSPQSASDKMCAAPQKWPPW